MITTQPTPCVVKAFLGSNIAKYRIVFSAYLVCCRNKEKNLGRDAPLIEIPS